MTASPELEYAAALVAFQTDLPNVSKGSTADTGSYTYDYTDLTALHDAAFPILTGHGFSWSCKPTVTDHGFVLRYVLRHTAGGSDGGDYPLPDPSRSTPQQIGSAISYGRRYSFLAVTGIAPGGIDDDGQAAKDARSRDQAARPPAETDIEWFDGIKARLDLAANATELEALNAEAKKAYNDRRLSPHDKDEWKALAANRATELGVTS